MRIKNREREKKKSKKKNIDERRIINEYVN